jgi:hypothetical protein
LDGGGGGVEILARYELNDLGNLGGLVCGLSGEVVMMTRMSSLSLGEFTGENRRTTCDKKIGSNIFIVGT